MINLVNKAFLWALRLIEFMWVRMIRIGTNSCPPVETIYDLFAGEHVERVNIHSYNFLLSGRETVETTWISLTRTT